MEAIRTVLEQFGDIRMIQAEVNESYPSAIKSDVVCDYCNAIHHQ